jgi:hypothetical protein
VDAGEHRASWALGWQVFHNPAGDFIHHGGNNRGFHSTSVASVKARRGFVAMTNGDGGVAVLRSILTSEVMQAFLAG